MPLATKGSFVLPQTPSMKRCLGPLKGSSIRPGQWYFPKVGAALLTNKRRRLVVPSSFDNNVMGLVATGCNVDFLYILMQTVDFARYVQSGAVPSVNGTKVGKIKALVPPGPEQQRIAAILSSVDDAIQQTQAVIDQVQVVKCGLMQTLLTRGLSGRGTQFKQTVIGEIPKEWQLVPLRDVGTWSSGGTPSRRNPDYWTGAIPWVSGKDMKRARLDDALEHVSIDAVGNGNPNHAERIDTDRGAGNDFGPYVPGRSHVDRRRLQPGPQSSRPG